MKLFPAIDLHLHLDGSLSLDNIKKLAREQNQSLDLTDEQLLQKLTVSPGCRDLNEYLEKFSYPNLFLQTEEGVCHAVKNLCVELKAKGFIYAEIRFAPQKSCDRGLTQELVVKAAVEGVKQSGFDANLILCAMRGQGNEKENQETVRLTQKYLGGGVCACDLAGAEALFPTENYRQLFELAKNLQVPFTIHAGEAAGSRSIALAVEYGASRIGHGVRCLEDEGLCRMLAEKNIPLELCPTSNLQTCVFDSIEKFPLMELMARNIPVTVNSDNMSVSGTDALKEMKLLQTTFRLEENCIKQFLLNSAGFSFAGDKLKASLIEKIKSYF